jgi:ABC-2 type transport system ATP-binding protein
MFEQVIEAGGVVKRFGKTTALDGLDLVAGHGSVLAVLGPNGAGKTTFVRCVATLIKPDGGTLRVFGHDVIKEPHLVRSSIGLAGQFAAVEQAMTGRENLEMVARLFGQDRASTKANVDLVLEQMELIEDADRLVREYSGGMRRKLDLGASLVGTPRLLLLDEPTTGVDPRSRIDLWDAIRTLVGRGTNVLLTTQYLDEADHLADQIVIIDHGKSIANGTPAELKKRTGRNVIEVHVRDREDVAEAAKVFAEIGDGDLRSDESTPPGRGGGEGRHRASQPRIALAPSGFDHGRRHSAASAPTRRGVPGTDRPQVQGAIQRRSCRGPEEPELT